MPRSEKWWLRKLFSCSAPIASAHPNTAFNGFLKTTTTVIYQAPGSSLKGTSLVIMLTRFSHWVKPIGCLFIQLSNAVSHACFLTEPRSSGHITFHHQPIPDHHGLRQKCFTWNIFVTWVHTLSARVHCRPQARQCTSPVVIKAAEKGLHQHFAALLHAV